MEREGWGEGQGGTGDVEGNHGGRKRAEQKVRARGQE